MEDIPNKNKDIEAASSSPTLKLEVIKKTHDVENIEEEFEEEFDIFNMTEDDIKACQKKLQKYNITTEQIMHTLRYCQEFRLVEIEMMKYILNRTVRSAQSWIDVFGHKAIVVIKLRFIADVKDNPALEHKIDGPQFFRQIADTLEAMEVEDEYYALIKALYECMVKATRDCVKKIDILLKLVGKYIAYPADALLPRRPPPLPSLGGAMAG